ncbi:hypothetical protein E4U43_004921 [Claviceps pusilla]|uniref:D-lactate dehydrogenase n=1 Tax=Claviceps pusilla TaxID=123648 RepID=A0A9P7N5H1_9HYPO|nr:hypothetical protein E4U43_004921 [Claviceps pusilla]
MRLALFSTKPYDRTYFEAAKAARGQDGVELIFHEVSLTDDTAPLSQGAEAVCVFVNDCLSSAVVEKLARYGVKAILLRCAGYNNVHLETAEKHGIAVANVPSYSPEAVAEFAVALVQTLNRNTHRAYNRVREGNFALDGLLGHTLHGRTVGIVGTGKIGLATARIMKGFGCRVLASDPFPSRALEDVGTYASLDELLPQCDIISLHCPLTDSTRHIINEHTIGKMKRGVMLVNTSRGGLIDTKAVIQALKKGQLGGLALDVYEGEGSLFYDDHSGEIIHDDVLMRLTTFHNVLVCGHQAFFTAEALTEIADCTFRNAEELSQTGTCQNMLTKGVLKRDALPVRSV